MTNPSEQVKRFAFFKECGQTLFGALHGGKYCLYSDYESLRQQLEAAQKEVQILRGSGAAKNLYLSIAEQLLDDPEYVMSGTDWDYEHPIHEKIMAIREQLEASQRRVAIMVEALQEIRLYFDATKKDETMRFGVHWTLSRFRHQFKTIDAALSQQSSDQPSGQTERK